MIRLRPLALLALLALVACVNAAGAAESSWATSDMARARLIAAAPAVGDAEALDLRPGDRAVARLEDLLALAGRRRRAAAAGLERLARTSPALDFLWPAPKRFTLFGLETFGYDDEVVFPLVLHAGAAGRAGDAERGT